MKRSIIGLSFLIIFTGCTETKHAAPRKYARLTVIYGKEDSFGIRYFWESPSEQTEAMSFEELHKHFGVERPVSGELKVMPFDYKVIERLVESGWSLDAVNSTAGYKEDSKKYKDAVGHDPVTTYHFSQ